MDARPDPTPFDQRLFLIFIVTFAAMTVFEFAGQYLYPYPPDWRSNLITSLFTSGLAVIIAYFPLKAYYDKNTQLHYEVAKRHDVEMELREREERLKKTNNKLTMLSTITRHDIKNQILSLSAYLELTKENSGNVPKSTEYLQKGIKSAETIGRQIDFTKVYEDMGTTAPVWQNVYASISRAVATQPAGNVEVTVDRSDLEVYADPLVEKVFYNLVENSIRHGGHVTVISFDTAESDYGLVIRCSDNGTGIQPTEKETVVLRGYGSNTGLGLFLIREILAITGISIKETGTFGAGARFEILVPNGAYRFQAG